MTVAAERTVRAVVEFKFSITISPFKVVRAAAIGTFMAFIAMNPVDTSSAADQLPPHLPTMQQLARDRAVKSVDSAVRKHARTPVPDAVRIPLVAAIVDFSIENKVDPLFVVALIQNESGFDHKIRSIRCREPGIESTCYLNAQGLMQVIPTTERAEVRRRGLTPKDMLDPVDNVNVGIGYVSYLGRGFKRISSLLWAYNQGPGVAMAKAKGEMPEGWTQERWDKAIAEGTAFEANVLGTYRKLLHDAGIKADYRKMNALFRNPEQTVYSAPAEHIMMIAQR